MFAGFVEFEGTIVDWLLVTDVNGLPYNTDVVPSYKVFGPSGPLPAAAGSSAVTASETGLYRATIAATGAAGFEVGETYHIVYSWTQSAVARRASHAFIVT